MKLFHFNSLIIESRFIFCIVICNENWTLLTRLICIQPSPHFWNGIKKDNIFFRKSEKKFLIPKILSLNDLEKLKYKKNNNYSVFDSIRVQLVIILIPQRPQQVWKQFWPRKISSSNGFCNNECSRNTSRRSHSREESFVKNIIILKYKSSYSS